MVQASDSGCMPAERPALQRSQEYPLAGVRGAP